MKLSVISLIFLAIFLRTSSLIEGVDFEDDPPVSNYPNNDYEEIITVEPEDAESNVTLQNDEIFKGNESIDVELLETTTESNIRRSFGNGKAKSPELDPDECGDPPAVTHAKVTSEKKAKYRENAKVTYNCEFGFIVAGPMQFSECLRFEETEELYWTDPGNLCAPRSCGDPGLVSNAHRLGFVFTFPNKVSYECDDGYKLRGFGSRYCQASGTWSGSLPTCEPVFCNPPSDPKNGKVYYSSLKFGSELRYECDPGFNLKDGEGRICSENGTWIGEEPICKEAQCEPPVAPEFGSVQVFGNGVGSMALYKCEDNFVLVGSATSRCLDIGVWTFPTPKCLEPCSVPKVDHGKIGRYVRSYGRKKFQELPEGAQNENNEKLYLTCESKYEPFGTTMTEEEITCNLGEWSRIPRCEPAKCRGRPPPTDNADVGSVNRTHNGGVVYHCKGYFKKTKFGNVTCSFGTWKGVTPVCKDTKCYLEKLSFTGLETKGLKNVYYRNQAFTATCKSGYNATKENNKITCADGEWKGHLPPCLAAPCNSKDIDPSEGIILSDDMKTEYLNGEHLIVKCGEGLTPSESKVRCSRGQWIISKKLCVESSCNVVKIDRGAFTQQVQKSEWNMFSGRKRWIEYEKVTVGSTKSPGSSLHVSCNKGYTFQGKGSNDVEVKCRSGQFYPNPVCLITGVPYEDEDNSKQDVSSFGNQGLDKRNPPENSAVDSAISVVHEENSNRQPSVDDAVPPPACTCSYIGLDDKVIAYYGTDVLEYGQEVKKNEKVKFQCREFGYYRLNGKEEITCEDCRPWHSAEYPSCVAPARGDAILEFPNDSKYLPGNTVVIQKGATIRIICRLNGLNDFPKWAAPDPRIVTVRDMRDTWDTNLLYGELYIYNIREEHNGRYECYWYSNRKKIFNIQVKVPTINCSKFDEREFHIYYDKLQAVNSSASFSCKDKNKKVVGPNVLTCLIDGRWSGNTPRCKTMCPHLNESEGMHISYNDNLNEGSIASFHCVFPRERTGVSHTTCRKGEWVDPMPTCTLPSCSLDSLFRIVPENVVPVMDNVTSDTLPFNYTLQLTCDGGLRISGIETATCGSEGWQISRVQCVAGCPNPLKTKDPELLVEPDKDFYRFGESVTLACNPGYVLSSEVVRLMCLGSTWSETELPHCQEE